MLFFDKLTIDLFLEKQILPVQFQRSAFPYEMRIVSTESLYMLVMYVILKLEAKGFKVDVLEAQHESDVVLRTRRPSSWTGKQSYRWICFMHVPKQPRIFSVIAIDSQRDITAFWTKSQATCAKCNKMLLDM